MRALAAPLALAAALSFCPQARAATPPDEPARAASVSPSVLEPPPPEGRRVRIILMRDGFVADSREEAEQVYGEAFVAEMLYYYDLGILSHHDPSIRSREDVTIDKLRKSLVIGTPQDCIRALERYRDEYRVDYVLMRFRMPLGPSAEATRRCIRMFGESVLPHFKS